MVAIQIGTNKGSISAGHEIVVYELVSLRDPIITSAISIHRDMPTS